MGRQQGAQGPGWGGARGSRDPAGVRASPAPIPLRDPSLPVLESGSRLCSSEKTVTEMQREAIA